MKIGDSVRYFDPDPILNGIHTFGIGIGIVDRVSVNTEHVFVIADNPLLSGWYHDYNLEVVNESQRTN